MVPKQLYMKKGSPTGMAEASDWALLIIVHEDVCTMSILPKSLFNHFLATDIVACPKFCHVLGGLNFVTSTCTCVDSADRTVSVQF